jgi:REP element-mobilizing transposase RayT
MSHTYSQVLLHIVFGTWDRAPMISPQIRDDLYQYMGGIVREARGTLIAVNGMPDHVHLLVAMPLTVSIAVLVREVKAKSSRFVHEKWPDRDRFTWQGGYGVFSVSHSAVEQVEKYIREQEEHHRKYSFEQEFRILLKRHNVAFDERYLWK